jgi:hypothetical protein
MLQYVVVQIHLKLVHMNPHCTVTKELGHVQATTPLIFPRLLSLFYIL